MEIEFNLLHHTKYLVPFIHEEELEHTFEDAIFDVSHTQAGAKLGFNSMKLSFVLVRGLKLNILVPFVVLALPDPSDESFSFRLDRLS